MTSAPPVPPWDAQLLTRDGHLSALALERRAVDPPDAGRDAFIDAHLASCPRCAAAAATLRAEDAAFALHPPPAALTAAAAATPRATPPRRARLALALTPLAAAAVALLVLAPWRTDAPDTLRARGGPLDLEVWVHDGARARLVATGDPVRPGERVGFRVKTRAPGHLLVLGVDDTGAVYPCYPQAGGQSAPQAATPTPRDLPAAVRLDATPGRERLVALLCDAPVSVAEVAGTLQRAAPGLTMDAAVPRLRADCAQREVVLPKIAP